MVRDEGITSFKLFMAYPGVFMVDDATIFRALRQTGENGGLVCMHAENGGVIDVLVKEALRKGQTAPKYHALTRPPRAEGEATGRAIALAEMAGVPIYIVHLSSARRAARRSAQARDMGLPAYAETCPQYLFLSYDNYEEPGFDGAKYVMSPPLREKWHQDVLWKGLAKNDLQVISTDHCPFCMNEQKELGQGRLQQDPERRARHRDAPDARPQRRRAPGTHQPEPLRRALLDDAGEDVRPVPAQGHDRRRQRRRHRRLRSRSRSRRSASKTLHMQVDYNPYEGTQVKGAPSASSSQRRRHHRGRTVRRQEGRGPLHQARPEPGPGGAVTRVDGHGILDHTTIASQIELR